MTTIEFKSKPIRTDDDALAFLTSIERQDMVVDGKVRVPNPCGRCGGSGNGGWYPDGGICYDCNGVNTKNRATTYGVKAYAQKIKRQLNAAEKRAADFRAQDAANMEAKIAGQRRWCESQGHGPITFAELDAKRAAEKAANAGLSNHVGTVKKREDFALTLVAIASWDGNFGTTYCHIFVDADGNKLVWKTSDPLGTTRMVLCRGHLEEGLGDEEGNELVTVPAGTVTEAGVACWSTHSTLEKGQKLVLKATVKEHGVRDGEKQTVLTRGKLVRLEG